MIPKAGNNTAAQSYLYRDQPILPDGGPAACPGCGQASAPDFNAETHLCVRCLFGLGLEPADSEAPRTADVPHPSLPLSPRSLGPYQLLEEIGRGGMGVIYRAVHRETNEIVAVKTLLPQNAGCPETLARFRRETEAARRLVHPHCVPVLATGCSEEGTPFFSMELALGGSLRGLVARYRGRWRQIAGLMVKIAGAVQHAHEQGILHRDLKPGNVLFTEDHEPLVTDFGLAKPLTGSDDLTRSCAMLGTPSYVAPEQAAGQTHALTPAADIYSLGAILFELLTGRPPFVGDNPLEVLSQVARGTPEPPRRLVPAVPPALDVICLRCLERHPEDRYASARALATDLERWLQGRKIAPRPAPVKLWNRVRRHRQAAAWAAAAVSILLGLGVAFLAFHRTQPLPAHPTVVAVAIDDLEQGDPALKDIAARATDSLKAELLAAGTFQVPDASAFRPHASTEVFDPLKYGRMAGAGTVLTGTVRYSDGGVRIAARLLRCDTGDVVWRRVATVSLSQVSSGLPAAAKTLVAALQKKWRDNPKALAASPAPPSTEALAYYNKAMELSVRQNRTDLEATVRLLRRACEMDPRFVPARAMLAYALMTQATVYGETGLLPLALSTARDALARDPDSAQAHRAVAAYYFRTVRYAEALPELWRGVELDPQLSGCASALGVCLREMGQPGQAIPWVTRAARLAPSRGAFSASLGETLVLCGLDAEAESALNRAAEIDQDRPEAQIDLSALRTWQKRFDEARQFCADARQRSPDYRWLAPMAAWIEFCAGNDEAAKAAYEALRRNASYRQDWEFYSAINPASALAYLAQRHGLQDEARALAEEALETDRELLNKYPLNSRVMHDLAATCAVMGDRTQAQTYLEQAMAAGWVEHRSTQIDPRFASLASTPEFRNLLARTFPSAALTGRTVALRSK